MKLHIIQSVADVGNSLKLLVRGQIMKAVTFKFSFNAINFFPVSLFSVC